MDTKTSYIHIDSASRNKEIGFVSSKSYLLPKNPINFEMNSSKVCITMLSHQLNIADMIYLNNVRSETLILFAPLQVKKHSNYVRVTHETHRLNLDSVVDTYNDTLFQPVDYIDHLPTHYSPHDDIPDSSDKYYILKEQHHQFPLSINGVTEFGSGNIAASQINTEHRPILIYRKKGNKYVSDPNSYLIHIQYPSNINHHYKGNIRITYSHLAGINISQLQYPNYHVVTNTSPNKIWINLHQHAFDTISGGGNRITLHSIDDIAPHYPQVNNYSIPLHKPITNITKFRVISSVFPAVFNINSSNNKLYWSNRFNEETMYHIELTPGHYTIGQLSAAIEDNINQIVDINTGGYHRSMVSISPTTRRITIKNYLSQQITGNDAISVIDDVLYIRDMEFDIPTILIHNGRLYQLQRNNRFAITDIPVIINTTYGDNGDHILFKANIGDNNIDPSRFINNITYVPDHGVEHDIIMITDQIEPGIWSYLITRTDNDYLTIKPLQVALLYNGYMFRDGSSIPRDFQLDRIINDRNSAIIKHPGHRLRTGDRISIENANSIHGIPSNTLNTWHNISEIIDSSHYRITLDPYLMEESPHPQYYSLDIIYPNYMQYDLRLSSLGELLGFDKDVIGYYHIISSVLGNINRDYFYIHCDNISHIENIDNVLDIVKMEECAPYIDCHVGISKTLTNSISLPELKLQIKYPDGTFVDFDNVDHSFTIELTHHN